LKTYLTLEQVRERLLELGIDVSVYTLRKHAREGKLPHVKPGRRVYVEEERLPEYIEQ